MAPKRREREDRVEGEGGSVIVNSVRHAFELRAQQPSSQVVEVSV
jgi:hypothetical protein